MCEINPDKCLTPEEREAKAKAEAEAAKLEEIRQKAQTENRRCFGMNVVGNRQLPGNCLDTAQKYPEIKLMHDACWKVNTDIANPQWCQLDDTNNVILNEYKYCMKSDGTIDRTKPACNLACRMKSDQRLCLSLDKRAELDAKIAAEKKAEEERKKKEIILNNCRNGDYSQKDDPGCEKSAMTFPDFKLRTKYCNKVGATNTKACSFRDSANKVFPEFSSTDGSRYIPTCINYDGNGTAYVDLTIPQCAKMCKTFPQKECNIKPVLTVKVNGKILHAQPGLVQVDAPFPRWNPRGFQLDYFKSDHGFKTGEKVIVTIQRGISNGILYPIILNIERPGTAPKPEPITSTISGKVSKVTSPSNVTATFTDPWIKKSSSVNISKVNHGLKVNDVVTLTIQNTTPRKVTSITKPAPKPAIITSKSREKS
jgi:hypothetical protein